MANNSGDGHPAVQDNLIQEDFEDETPDLNETGQLLRVPAKKGIVFVRKIPSSLLRSVMQDTFASRQTSMLTTSDADSDSSHPELNECSETAIVDESRNQIPFVKTIIVHQKHRQTQYTCPSPTLSLRQPDENKNSILLLKAPATYVPLSATAITASKQHNHQHYQPQLQQFQQQLQTDIVYSELSAQRGLYQQQQTIGDYHHHQQHDQRKALTKLFLPNKIHVKPILHQKQFQISTANTTTTTNNISNESSSHVGLRNGSKNIVSKIKVLNLRKRFMTSATNH
ncbi:hypothetical protein DOY81_007397 [Sarcophaga bullata]|nr:hypothetical protein DOY81_007397 [Sarcophaga bullata]